MQKEDKNMTAINEVNTVNERNMDLLKRKEFHSIIIGGKHLISKKSFDAWLDGIELGPE